MNRAIATPPGQPTQYIDLTPEETTARQAEEAAFLTKRITDALPAYRYEIENGGIAIGGISIQTDQFTRTNLIGARIRATEDPTYSVKWKTTAGFVTLDASAIVAVADAVAAHVQKCFDAEAAITGQTFDTINAMKAAFDEAYEGQ